MQTSRLLCLGEMPEPPSSGALDRVGEWNLDASNFTIDGHAVGLERIPGRAAQHRARPHVETGGWRRTLPRGLRALRPEVTASDETRLDWFVLERLSTADAFNTRIAHFLTATLGMTRGAAAAAHAALSTRTRVRIFSSGSTCVAGKDEVSILYSLMAGEACRHHRLVRGFAVLIK